MNRSLVQLALAASLFVAGGCGDRTIVMPPSATTEATDHRMTVTGTAVLEVSPDIVDLTMTVSADGARPAVAATEAQRKQRELVDALAKLGIDGSSVKLSQLTLRPIYASTTEGWQVRVATYRAEVTITATTTRFDQIAAIMETGAAAGASELATQFRRSDIAELKKKVRDLALTAAKAKAEQSAKTLGIPLGRVVSVSEGTASHTPWERHLYPNYLGNNPGNTARVHDTSGAALGGTLQALTLDVTISFHLPRET